MEHRKQPSTAFVAALILLLGLSGAVGIWWLPRRAAQRRRENERKAVQALSSIHIAQADFRANDRDGNGVQDFWTGDIAGLLQYGRIDRATAEADTRPLRPLVPLPIPRDGYYFRALEADDSEAPPEVYRQETDRKSGKVHHESKFGFLAYPGEPGVTGNHILILNENGTVFCCPATMPVPQGWPSDPTIKASWWVYGRK